MKHTTAANKSMVVGGWEFNRLQLEDMKMYSYYLKRTLYPTNVFSWNFPFIWAESHKRTITWKIIDDMLVTFRHLRNGEIDLWCLPFGTGDLNKVVNVLYDCLSFCKDLNAVNSSNAIVRVINSPQLEFLSGSKKFNRLFKIKKLKSIERVDGIYNMLNLNGQKYKNVRNRINKFHRSYPEAVIREYTPNDYNALIRIQQIWNNNAGKKYNSIMDQITYKEYLKHYKELNQLILVVEIDDKIVGMISGGISPVKCAWSYFIKAIDGIPGIYEVMAIELARAINKIDPSIELINVGSDLGREGLAHFKEKFRSVQKFERYIISI